MWKALRFVVLLLCVACTSAGAARAQESAGEADFLYVANQGEASVAVIDMARNEVVGTVDLQELGFSPTAKPHHVVVEPDGSHWYVSLIGANRVLKFDRQNQLVGQVELEVPGMMALDPASDLLYVGRSMSAVNPPPSIGVVDRAQMEVLEEVDVLFPRPHAIALTPDGGRLYVGSLAQNRIAVIDTESLDVSLESVGGPVHTFVQFAVAPDGKTLGATGQMSGQFLLFDTTDPDGSVVTDTLRVDAAPWHPVYTPDGRYIYFGNKMADRVTVVDAQERRVVAVIEGEGLAQPHGSAVRPDGRYVYISNNNLKGEASAHKAHQDVGHDEMPGTIVVIDTETQEIVRVLEVGTNPTGIGARPAVD